MMLSSTTRRPERPTWASSHSAGMGLPVLHLACVHCRVRLSCVAIHANSRPSKLGIHRRCRRFEIPRAFMTGAIHCAGPISSNSSVATDRGIQCTLTPAGRCWQPNASQLKERRGCGGSRQSAGSNARAMTGSGASMGLRVTRISSPLPEHGIPSVHSTDRRRWMISQPFRPCG